jgi:hypothetical protein
MQKVRRIVTVGISWVGDRSRGLSRRPPIYLSRIAARTHMCAYAANVWNLSIIQGPETFCRPVPNLTVSIRNFPIAVFHGISTCVLTVGGNSARTRSR